MVKLTIEEENILAMMSDVSTKSEMLEALEGVLEHMEDAEMMTLIAQCAKRVKHMTDDEFENQVVTAAEELS